MAAFSSLSLPWTAFLALLSAKRLRMVPSAAWAGSVAPIRSRNDYTALSFSRIAATMGPLAMYSTSSP